MTLIEVKSHQLVISKKLQGASVLTPTEVTSHIFYAEIAYLMTYFENDPAFQNSSAYLTTCSCTSASEGNPMTPIEVESPTTYDLINKCFSFRG